MESRSPAHHLDFHGFDVKQIKTTPLLDFIQIVWLSLKTKNKKLYIQAFSILLFEVAKTKILCFESCDCTG